MWKILSGRRPRRDDGGASVAQQSTATGSTVHLPDAVKQIYANDQYAQLIRRGSVRGVKESEIVNTTDLEADDIVIAVMGPTGSGKSTIISAASGRDTNPVGHNLSSFADQISTVKFWDQESKRHIVLVDTPGFDDTFKSDLDILSMISEWLVSSYNKKKLLSGILYLHRITDNRVAGSSLKNLRVFRKLCGKDSLDKVHLTTTMWDEVELSIGERRLEELKTECWKTMITQGAHVACCRSDDDSPQKLIRQIVLSEYSSKTESYGGTPPPQTLPLESRQGPYSHSQEKHQRYDVPRNGTLIPHPSVENSQGLSPPSQVVGEKTHIGGKSTHSELLYVIDLGLLGIRSSFNIVLFGEAGVGKSSVINLIADEDVAETSRNAWGCTLESKQHTFNVAERTFNIWDTIGLGEPMFGATDYFSAIEKTSALIRQIEAQGGLDLLLFCIPGSGSRITKTMLCNYRLFFEVLCEKHIPIAVVVTRLEDEERMEEWWDRNGEYMSEGGLKFGGHACITGRRGHPKAAEGRSALELLLLGYDRKGRYPMPPASHWFSGFLERLPSIPRSKLLKDKQKELERLLRDRCMMDSADAQRLAESLARPREHDR